MVYKYIIDNGEYGEDLVTNVLFSEIKFSPEEFKQIVEDAYVFIGDDEDDWDYFGLGSTIAEYIEETDERFFSIKSECIIEVKEPCCGNKCSIDIFSCRC